LPISNVTDVASVLLKMLPLKSLKDKDVTDVATFPASNIFIKNSSFQSRRHFPNLVDSLKKKIAKAPPAGPQIVFNWPALLVSLLIGVAAFSLAAAQFHSNQDPQGEPTLADLDQRVDLLESVTNPIQRDSYCVGLSAYGRALDSALDPNARVFLTGMMGTNNVSCLGYYFFLRHYLFPRDVEISLDKRIIYSEDGFIGPACDSPAVLKTNGFDLVILFNNNQMQLVPLTPKGVPKQE
jgi:hypothetical protein